MKMQIFQDWNWEYDFGEKPISENDNIPPLHAVAYYDDADRIYRVQVLRSPSGFGPLRESEKPELFMYDYFCDQNGRILQKRSLGENGEVVLIVDLQYDDTATIVTETAWSPDGGRGKSIKRPNKHH